MSRKLAAIPKIKSGTRILITDKSHPWVHETGEVLGLMERNWLGVQVAGWRVRLYDRAGHECMVQTKQLRVIEP